MTILVQCEKCGCVQTDTGGHWCGVSPATFDRLRAELAQAREQVARVEAERDEAKAEVERLTGLKEELKRVAIESVKEIEAERDEARRLLAEHPSHSAYKFWRKSSLMWADWASKLVEHPELGLRGHESMRAILSEKLRLAAPVAQPATERVLVGEYWQFSGYRNQYGSREDARLAQGMQVHAGHLDGKPLVHVRRYRPVPRAGGGTA